MFEVRSSGSKNMIVNKFNPCISGVHWPIRGNQMEEEKEPKGNVASGGKISGCYAELHVPIYIKLKHIFPHMLIITKLYIT